MRLKGWAFGLSVAAFAAAPAYAGDKVLFGPPPSWVVAHPTGSEPSQAGDLPIEFQQIDNQVHYEGATETTYSLVRLKFLTPQGLQAGNLSYSWEPNKGDLTVNRVVIHRGDQIVLARLGGELVLEAFHAGFAGHLALVADIDGGGRILADQHHRQPGRAPRLFPESRDEFRHAGA